MNDISIKFAEEKDVDLILSFIQELAHYEKLAHEVVATKVGIKVQSNFTIG